ncbi:MAG TPA: hypothetical protein VGN72_00990 [Tepidisphaeraceae bacterium]|nr:hypothetical protein [Tepidisphaeraceae bacterium]
MSRLESFVPMKRKRNRKRRDTTASPPAPPVEPLTLVSAVYDGDVELVLTLTFSRAIDVDAIDGAAIIVNDPGAMLDRLIGTGGATLEGPATVRIGLVTQSVPPVPGPVTLTAGADNGIVAVDGGAWAGVTAVVLPFG